VFTVLLVRDRGGGPWLGGLPATYHGLHLGLDVRAHVPVVLLLQLPLFGCLASEPGNVGTVVVVFTGPSVHVISRRGGRAGRAGLRLGAAE
jgi:hypothetical protein